MRSVTIIFSAVTLTVIGWLQLMPTCKPTLLEEYRAGAFGVCTSPGTVACPTACYSDCVKDPSSTRKGFCMQAGWSGSSGGPRTHGVCSWSILPWNSCVTGPVCGTQFDPPSNCGTVQPNGNCPTVPCAAAGAWGNKCP